jgi:hypothetical protein
MKNANSDIVDFEHSVPLYSSVTGRIFHGDTPFTTIFILSRSRLFVVRRRCS